MQMISRSGFALLFILLFPFVTPAQAPRALLLGEPCPNFQWKAVGTDGQEKTFTLQDFRGKLVILDFWATWCAACIPVLPKLDSLQRKYGDQVAIIPVSYENRSNLLTFISRNEMIKHSQLPFVYGDTLTRQYFPYRSIPHDVWIDSSGRLLGSTYPEMITGENIQRYKKGLLRLTQTKQDLLDKDLSKALLLGATGTYQVPDSLIAYSALITETIPGMSGTSFGIGNLGKSKRLLCVNMNINQLYKHAFLKAMNFPRQGDNINFPMYQIIRQSLESKDSSIFYWPGKDLSRWAQHPYFSYELIVPPADSANMYNLMQEDLNRYFRSRFHIEGKMADRTVRCWVLKETDRALHPPSTADSSQFVYNELLKKGYWQKKSVRDLLFSLMIRFMQLADKPFIDETNFAGKIDMNLDNVDLSKMASLQLLLHKYGFEFVEEWRTIPMLVITDSP